MCIVSTRQAMVIGFVKINGAKITRACSDELYSYMNSTNDEGLL